MDNMNLTNKKLLSLTLSTAGVIFSVFMPIMGYLFLVPSLVLTGKREDMSMLHLFVFDIVALISITVIFIVSIVQSLS